MQLSERRRMNIPKNNFKKLFSLLLCKIFILFFILGCFQLICENHECLAQSKIKTHAVLYGGISDKNLDKIAKNYDILILGTVKEYQLKKIKQINPDITILKYHHSIGMHTVYSDWSKVNKKEEWFAHDRITGKRMLQKNYGWYLMDISNNSWRRYWVDRLVKTTEDLYDGVFLDDFWGTYIDKFQLDDSDNIPKPIDKIINNWNHSMISLLQLLDEKYKGVTYINSISVQYIPYADGCMAESFVHSSWNSDSFYHNPSTYLRTINKINRLKKYGKIILVQSGSNNDGTGNIRDIFNFCYASFLLISDDITSFYFLPRANASYRGMAFHPSITLGKPKGDYYTFYEGKFNNNLIPDADFKESFMKWNVSGNPSLVKANDGYAVMFKGDAKGRDIINTGLIPIKANTKYILTALCKSEKNESGSARYKRLAVHFNYLNTKKEYIGFGDIIFEQGKYDWMPFETKTVSPSDAAYIKIQVGFRGDGKGKGWIKDLGLYAAEPVAKVLRRDFEYGLTLVNYGTKDFIADDLIIKAHHGIIIKNTPPNESIN